MRVGVSSPIRFFLHILELTFRFSAASVYVISSILFRWYSDSLVLLFCFSAAFRDGRAVRCRCRQGPPRALARDGTGQKERGDGIWTVQQQTPIETCVLRVPYAKRVWRTGRFLLLLERTLAVFPSSHQSCLACLLARVSVGAIARCDYVSRLFERNSFFEDIDSSTETCIVRVGVSSPMSFSGITFVLFDTFRVLCARR